MYQIEWCNSYIITTKTEFKEWCSLNFDYEREEYFNFLASNRIVYRIED
ncbi:Uncharacterised protein [Vibrio cholerae]|nr:Uncharacterised protein [Vibrio cholerae]